MDIGDKVRLSTGGPAMVLTKFNEDGMAEVAWFSGTTLNYATFPLKSLVAADDAIPDDEDTIKRMLRDYCPGSWTTAERLYEHFKDRVACEPDTLWRLCEKKAAAHNASLEAK